MKEAHLYFLQRATEAEEAVSEAQVLLAQENEIPTVPITEQLLKVISKTNAVRKIISSLFRWASKAKGLTPVTGPMTAEEALEADMEIARGAQKYHLKFELEKAKD